MTPAAAVIDQMVTQQVRAWQVHDDDLLQVMRQVPRAPFLPAALRAYACADVDLPLGNGQMVLSPKLEGRILQAIRPAGHEHAVVIGAANAHLAACLCQLVTQVTLLERNAAALEIARGQVLDTGVNNLRVIHDDPAQWHNDQGFDLVVLTSSMASLPAGLQQTLTVGGRLFAVVGDTPAMSAVLVTRSSATQWHTQSLFETMLPRLAHTPSPGEFVF